MAGFRSPLDAYRADLARAPGRKRLAADDEFWIILATGLRRLAQAPRRSRSAAARRLSAALLTFAKQVDRTGVTDRLTRSVEPTMPRHAADLANALKQFPTPEFASALVTHVCAVAANAEESGAVLIAREMLTDLTKLSAHAPAIDRGSILLRLGRLASTLGDLDSAVDLLRAAGDLGRAEGVPELVAGEAVAQAAIERTRGRPNC